MFYFLIYLLILSIILPYTLILLSVNRTNEENDESASTLNKSFQYPLSRKRSGHEDSHSITFLV